MSTLSVDQRIKAQTEVSLTLDQESDLERGPTLDTKGNKYIGQLLENMIRETGSSTSKSTIRNYVEFLKMSPLMFEGPIDPIITEE